MITKFYKNLFRKELLMSSNIALTLYMYFYKTFNKIFKILEEIIFNCTTNKLLITELFHNTRFYGTAGISIISKL